MLEVRSGITVHDQMDLLPDLFLEVIFCFLRASSSLVGFVGSSLRHLAGFLLGVTGHLAGLLLSII